MAQDQKVKETQLLRHPLFPFFLHAMNDVRGARMGSYNPPRNVWWTEDLANPEMESITKFLLQMIEYEEAQKQEWHSLMRNVTGFSDHMIRTVTRDVVMQASLRKDGVAATPAPVVARAAPPTGQQVPVSAKPVAAAAAPAQKPPQPKPLQQQPEPQKQPPQQ